MKAITLLLALIFTSASSAQNTAKPVSKYHKPKTEVLTLIKGEVWGDAGDILFKTAKGTELTVHFIPENVVKCIENEGTTAYGVIEKSYLNKKYKVTYEIQERDDFGSGGKWDATVATKMVLVK